MLATCLLTSTSAYGHMLNMTSIDVRVDKNQQAKVSLDIDIGQSLMSAEDYWAATQLTGPAQQAALEVVVEKLKRDITILADGAVRHLTLTGYKIGATSLDAIRNPLTPQMATFYYSVDLSGAKSFSVQLDDQLDIPWPCLVKVEAFGQALPQSRLLTDVDRVSQAALIEPGQNIAESMRASDLFVGWSKVSPTLSWVAVGFQHIVPRGLDHILFILGLFFLAGGWRTLLLQVTGFTIAHSLTLGLSIYGLIQVPSSIVEPLIALSIVYIAVDNLFETKLAHWRIAVVCLFGLLHGLGFASVLADIGLPQDQFLLGLGLFNLGVELGQLTVIATAFFAVGWFRRQSWYQSIIAQPATIAIAGTGAYWFLKRIAF